MAAILKHDVQGWGGVIELDAWQMPGYLRDHGITALWREEQMATRPGRNDGYIASLRAATKRQFGSEQFTLQGIFDLFEKGWPQGAQVAIDLARELMADLPTPKDLRRKLVFADHGDELLIDRLYSGQLDRMWRTRRRKYAPTQTVVSIGTHLCTFSTDPLQTIISGSQGIALAYLLEQYGYRVEMLSIFTGRGNTYGAGSNVAIVRVKEAHEPLQPDYIAAVHHAAVAHVAVGKTLEHAGCCNAGACDDSASRFATDFMLATGRRIDYCFDYSGSREHAKHELKRAVRHIGGRIFENTPTTEEANA